MAAPIAPPVQQIYQMLNGMFGQSSTQIFQMEFPGRVLDKGTYDYAGSDSINAQQLKPQVVTEAEFRLSNDMYSLSNMVSGPNGVKFTESYKDVLYNFIPTVPTNDQTAELLHNDQDRICAWLTQKVPNWTPPKDDFLKDIPVEYDGHKPPAQSPISVRTTSNVETLPRVDLYQKLVDAYESERFRWKLFKINARPKNMATASAAAIDNYNRMLANYAPIVDQKLEALWTMVLVRGQYHRVRRFIGFIDVESAPESLQRAKENLRASIMRSIDDSHDVYPVYFTPATWASKLSTAFKPEDLLSSATVVRDQLIEKEKQRALLIMKRNNAKGSQKNIAALEDAETAARTKYFDTRDVMLTGYSDTAVNLIKMYFDAKSRKNKNKVKAIEDIGSKDELNDIMAGADESPLTDAQFNSLKTMQQETIKSQTALQIASEALSRSQLSAASARGGDLTAFIYELDEQIQSLTIDIDYLSRSLEGSENATGVALAKPSPGNPNGTLPAVPATVVPTTPSLPPQERDASIWTDITTTLTKSSSYTTTMSAASASHLDWSVNLFFGSASGSESSSSASSSSLHTAENTEIQIGFRCMKVVMDRPWLNAGVFARSRDYFRNSRTKFSSGSPETIRGAFNQPGGTVNPGAQLLQQASSCSLPAWPVAFIVVKDVHIVFKADSEFLSSTVTDMQKAMSSGGGFLCFSCAKSESSSEHRTGGAMEHNGQTLSIKIPAPQIIGWIQQLAPEDMCQTAYGAINPNEFITLDDVPPPPQPNPPHIGPPAPPPAPQPAPPPSS
ncbi:hypothetical protein M501DRAFT_209220 [Patellaria atrata CBS 101060]|uniref:Uncharacterized protein n=1 Tax=Patellaria atrata CBS 101060 TaxID=1346257 RepID=A0A9P4VKZ8_9PEZI|nr:hypothetical protein M501DRAFT_209220 [Patellaria atrata CBS 101060]